MPKGGCSKRLFVVFGCNKSISLEIPFAVKIYILWTENDLFFAIPGGRYAHNTNIYIFRCKKCFKSVLGEQRKLN